MAASAGKMVGVCEDSSSSDEEELRRCQEAVWETRGHLSKGELVRVRSVTSDGVNVSAQEEKELQQTA